MSSEPVTWRSVVSAADEVVISKQKCETKVPRGIVKAESEVLVKSQNLVRTWNNKNEVVCSSGVPHVHFQKHNAYLLEISEYLEELEHLAYLVRYRCGSDQVESGNPSLQNFEALL